MILLNHQCCMFLIQVQTLNFLGTLTESDGVLEITVDLLTEGILDQDTIVEIAFDGSTNGVWLVTYESVVFVLP